MHVLMACAGGMSSSLLANYLSKEAQKNDISDFYIEAVGTMRVAKKLTERDWDIFLLAPQVRFHKEMLLQELADYEIPFLLIDGPLYTPIGAPKLFGQMMELLK
ncbi:PTS sugar transporter subunit IIB [Listeria grayi]|uniref:PTS sugar transporter subunit IIB n=1 Tax=Listeria grayi TaxID=1641 RepID=UPI00162362EB|nr:PTS diacetylchitobiose transporter subunit IIB [Listeria grayi]MBC1922737.1 PTS diacetylchitobiose transporter subunit IIB [Listeria grayi]